MAREQGFSTRQIHGGHQPDMQTGSRAVPIYQTTSYVYPDADAAARIYGLTQKGHIYTRLDNPTNAILEERLALLEGGSGALVTASGMAAILYAILNIAGIGDEIIAAKSLYGGTHTLFTQRMEKQFGIKVHLAEADDADSFARYINEKTKAIYFESMGNPGINIPAMEEICAIAHAHGIPVICDNTFGTPYLVDMKKWGVDIVVHSLTKYMGGHGTSVGGAIVDMGVFDWGNGKFPALVEPDETYHGIVYGDNMETAYITKARAQVMRDTGACLSPFNAFLILLGIETLSLRMEKHSENGLAVARYLEKHPKVAWVRYPGLETSPDYERGQKYFPRGCGGILTFGIVGGLEAGKQFIDSLQLFSLLANVADAKSLVIHPASTTHSQMSEEEQIAAEIPPEMIRLSIGLEDIADIIADLEYAFDKVK
ncbi:O-acetylhomoserine aminocarboxypropyltransferase/cysteine synthase [Eubacteriales bacterium OttesenSCG-928-M02]|nr:O-acetylhomoserine aminocarboxypropyltransferase/cysteine synthase [Eubacteriales bacterium OttesenSCG-928-M02]